MYIYRTVYLTEKLSFWFESYKMKIKMYFGYLGSNSEPYKKCINSILFKFLAFNLFATDGNGSSRFTILKISHNEGFIF